MTDIQPGLVACENHPLSEVKTHCQSVGVAQLGINAEDSIYCSVYFWSGIKDESFGNYNLHKLTQTTKIPFFSFHKYFI